jgi:hypothetical protein
MQYTNAISFTQRHQPPFWILERSAQVTDKHSSYQYPDEPLCTQRCFQRVREWLCQYQSVKANDVYINLNLLPRSLFLTIKMASIKHDLLVRRYSRYGLGDIWMSALLFHICRDIPFIPVLWGFERALFRCPENFGSGCKMPRCQGNHKPPSNR